MNGYLKTYNRVKYFLLYLSRLLNETAFYAKLSGRFLGNEIEVTWLIALICSTNMQMNNLKLLVARPNFM